MVARPTVAMAALLVVAALLVAAAPAAGVTVNQPSPSPDNASNASFGTVISAFMQASAADAEGTVDSGMWAAGFARADESARAAMIRQRTGTLEQRLEDLETRREALLNASADNISSAERAQAARLIAETQALHDAINRTRAAGQSIGVDVSPLDRMSDRARGIADGEMAAVAGTPITPPRGPPQGTGPSNTPGSATDAGHNGSASGTDTPPTDGNGTDTAHGTEGADGSSNGGTPNNPPRNDG